MDLAQLSPVIIETNRLALREITLADAAFIIEVLNDQGFLDNVGDRNVRTIEDAENYINTRIRSSYELYGFGSYAMVVKQSNEHVGICGLVKRDHLPLPDIGFAVLERFSGRGYAFEAAKAVVDHAHQALGLTQIAGITRPHNHTSQHLLLKLGLRFERQISMPDSNYEWMVFS